MALDVAPATFCPTPDGVLLIADGINAVRRWDGMATTTDTAGVIPPTPALTLSGTGKGPISGTFYGFERFVDSRDNFSNLNTISSAYRPFTCGAVESASNTSPIAIGATAHGLSTGDKVSLANVAGNTAANGTWTIIVRDANNYSLNGSVGNSAYTSGGFWVSGLTTPPFAGAITAATNATPIAITSANHGMATNDKVTITGVGGNTAANSNWTITVSDANTYTLNTSIGNSAYTSGGFYVQTRVTPTAGTVVNATNATPVAIGSVAHGLVTNDTVVVEGVLGNTAANGSWTATVTDANNFTLADSLGSSVVGNGTYAGGGTWYGGSGPPLFTGPITGATNASPIVITSVSHGLTDGDVVVITGVKGNSAANGTWPVQRVSANTFNLVGATGSAAYTSGGYWTAGVRAIRYTSAPLSTETKVTRRQFLRSTDGQAATFYVDLDETDLSSTAFTSTADDTTVATGTAAPLLNSAGSLAANVHDVPPSYKLAVINHLERTYYLAERTVRQGSCQVTNGSTTVYGIGTSWKSTFAGRTIAVVGATQLYTISSVNETTQTATLTASYTDSTNKFALYAIRPAPSERRIVYYSEAGLPESVPVLNQILLAETNDELTGAMQAGSYLYFLERLHIWRYSVQSDPAVDGSPWLASHRGCVNNRCWAIVEDSAMMLDEAGVHAFSGQSSDPIGEPIQDLFRRDNADYGINWNASDLFHCLHEPDLETISWFVALAGEYEPRHALCYQYRQKRWWVEEFARPIGASALGRSSGRGQGYLGSAFKVLAKNVGFMDGPDPTTGTVHGTVTSASLLSLTDSLATFPTVGLVGHPIDVVDGTGKGQRRIVAAVSGTSITPNQPWTIALDTTSIYQLGGISWQYYTGDYRWLKQDGDSQRRIEIHFSPVDEPAIANLQILFDEDTSAQTWVGTYYADDHQGVAVVSGEADLRIDMTHATGTAQQRMDFHRELYTEGPRYVDFFFHGVANSDQLRLIEFTLDGVQK